jgi:hypothetical protein
MQVVGGLPDFPVGNPFHHDTISCGMDLRDCTVNDKLAGVYVMSSSMNNSYDFYVVNSKTGKRIGIKL